MKDKISLLIAFVVVILNSSFSNPASNISIEIINLKSNKGYVLVSLFNDAKGFPNSAAAAVGKTKVQIHNGRAMASFTNLPGGKYAAAILHDENNNLKMDFNLVGMPKEGYGFSNDAKGFFGPPSFEKAAFVVEGGDKRVIIKASYFLR